MASRTFSRRETDDHQDGHDAMARDVARTSANANQLATAANDHDGSEVLGSRVNAVLDQLIAMRFELVHSVVPRAERGVFMARDLDYVRVQLDAAVAATRGIAATCGVIPPSVHRQGDFWRSEDKPLTKATEQS